MNCGHVRLFLLLRIRAYCHRFQQLKLKYKSEVPKAEVHMSWGVSGCPKVCCELDGYRVNATLGQKHTKHTILMPKIQYITRRNHHCSTTQWRDHTSQSDIKPYHLIYLSYHIHRINASDFTEEWREVESGYIKPPNDCFFRRSYWHITFHYSLHFLRQLLKCHGLSCICQSPILALEQSWGELQMWTLRLSLRSWYFPQ